MKIKRFFKKIGLAVMACLMIAGVQSCSDSDSDGGAVGNGTVSGIVTDEQENPIDGVKVSLHATGASVTTNSAGEYSLPNVWGTKRSGC